jgi:hypothetical protein
MRKKPSCPGGLILHLSRLQHRRRPMERTAHRGLDIPYLAVEPGCRRVDCAAAAELSAGASVRPEPDAGQAPAECGGVYGPPVTAGCQILVSTATVR